MAGPPARDPDEEAGTLDRSAPEKRIEIMSRCVGSPFR